jgi:hypothetical protein
LLLLINKRIEHKIYSNRCCLFQMLNYLLNDRLFVSYICPSFWFVGSIAVFIAEIILDIKVPYGRYNTSNSGVPVRLAWFIQELPCFVIPCYLLYSHWSLVTMTKFMIIGFFLTHYFQRYVEY